MAGGRDYAVAANRNDLVFYRLIPVETPLVRAMDGTATVAELVVGHLDDSGDLDATAVVELVRALEEGNFFTDRFVDVDAAVGRALHPISRVRAKAGEFVRTLSIDTTAAERLVRFLYRWLFRVFFVRPVQVVCAVVALVGVVAFVVVERSGNFEFAPSPSLGAFFLLMALNAGIIFLHELGHALVTVHYGRRIRSAGFRIYFGAPSFFVDSSDGLMLERGQRIRQAFAGVYSESIVAGAFAIVLWTAPGIGGGDVFYRFLVLSYFTMFLNLVPLLELDGYWILVDWLRIPDLRPRSLSFVRYELWAKLRRRQRLAGHEVGLTLYGIAGVVFSVASLVVSFFFWRRIFGNFMMSMWDHGPGTRVLLIVLIVFVTGPLVRATIRAIRTLVRAVARRQRLVWFRLQRRWRIEAATLLRDSGTFSDLPLSVLNDLAGRTQRRHVNPGHTVVRQGERADAYYLIRAGTFTVIEHDPDTHTERQLHTLGPGQGFGERGLLTNAPRNATVRAVTSGEVFVFDKSTFQRLLADHATVTDLPATLQELGELAELGPFAHLGRANLQALRAHGHWQQTAPGDIIIRQGEPGDTFYAIGSGQLDVTQHDTHIATLGPGDHFGETALLTGAPRNATVQTRTPARLFCLSRAGFHHLLADSFHHRRPKAPPPSDHHFDH